MMQGRKTQDSRHKTGARGAKREGGGKVSATLPEVRSGSVAKPQTLRATVPPRAPCKPAGGAATGLGGPEVAKRVCGEDSNPPCHRASACSV